MKVRHKRGQDFAQVVDQSVVDDEVVALVPSKRISDAYLFAAAPEMFDRLTELRHLKRKADGRRTAPLLPPEAIAAIDITLVHARGRK